MNASVHTSEGKEFTIYVAASYRHLHGVHLLYKALCNVCHKINILDWTTKGEPPAGMTPAQRREFFDTDHGGQIYTFCSQSCASADLVIYYGESGQDAALEVGLAAGSGVEVIGLRGPLEAPGLMLHGAVSEWAPDVRTLLAMVRERIQIKMDVSKLTCVQCELWGYNGHQLFCQTPLEFDEGDVCNEKNNN